MKRTASPHFYGPHQVFVRYAEAVGIKSRPVLFPIISMQETEEAVRQLVRTGCGIGNGAAAIEAAKFDYKREKQPFCGIRLYGCMPGVAFADEIEIAVCQFKCIRIQQALRSIDSVVRYLRFQQQGEIRQIVESEAKVFIFEIFRARHAAQQHLREEEKKSAFAKPEGMAVNFHQGITLQHQHEMNITDRGALRFVWWEQTGQFVYLRSDIKQ